MTPTTRLIVNTVAQNIRTVVNICLSLYSTRLVMNILGQSDYGIYMLVAGIVSFLSYLTNSLVTTTQRHLSYSYGQRDIDQTKNIFANSYLANTLLGVLFIIFLMSLTFKLFDGITLNIELEKIKEARWVYLIILSSVFFTFITAPFKALFVARENIVYISIIDILDGILKVVLVFGLYFFNSYRLIVYSCIISFVMLFNFMALALYAKLKYEECSLIPNLKKWDNQIQKKLLGFTTWTIYGSMSAFLRTQGIAVILNRAFGTIINASFGIATQILGSITFLSSAIINAFTPQIIKSEGEGNRKKMLTLCLQSCKYCYLLMLIFTLPVIFEIEGILTLWLGRIPSNAPLFCCVFLVSAVIDQLTTSMNIANQALGNIRNYTLLINTTKLLTLPVIWYAMHCEYSLTIVMQVYLFFEIITALMRLPYISRTTGLKTDSYLRFVLVPVLIPTAIAISACYAATLLPIFPLRFMVTGIMCVTTTTIGIWFFTFNKSEKDYIKTKLISKL